MAGSRLNNYSSTDNNITQMQLTEDASYIGKHNVTLTNMSTVAVPAIAGGSICEVNGALFKFSTDEPISTTTVTSTANGTWYIKLIPSSSQCTAGFSTVNPVWMDSRQGWYESTTTNNRYINYLSSYVSTTGYSKIKTNNSVNRFYNKIILTSSTLPSSAAYFFNLSDSFDLLSEVSSSCVTFSKSGMYNVYTEAKVNHSTGSANQILIYINSTSGLANYNSYFNINSWTNLQHSLNFIQYFNKDDKIYFCGFDGPVISTLYQSLNVIITEID